MTSMTNAKGWEIDPKRSFADMDAATIPYVKRDHAAGHRHLGDHPDVDEAITSHKNGIGDDEFHDHTLTLPDGRVLTYHPKVLRQTGMYSIGDVYVRGKKEAMVTAVEVIEYLRQKTASTGYTGLFNSNITSPIALATLAGPSLYHMATGREASDDSKDLAEIGGLGLLIHGEIPALIRSIGSRGRN